MQSIKVIPLACGYNLQKAGQVMFHFIDQLEWKQATTKNKNSEQLLLFQKPQTTSDDNFLFIFLLIFWISA